MRAGFGLAQRIADLFRSQKLLLESRCVGFDLSELLPLIEYDSPRNERHEYECAQNKCAESRRFADDLPYGAGYGEYHCFIAFLTFVPCLRAKVAVLKCATATGYKSYQTGDGVSTKTGTESSRCPTRCELGRRAGLARKPALKLDLGP